MRDDGLTSRMAPLTLSEGASDFIDDTYLSGLIADTHADAGRVRATIAKSLAKEALSVEETAGLLAADAPELVEEIFEAARTLKRTVYGLEDHSNPGESSELRLASEDAFPESQTDA